MLRPSLSCSTGKRPEARNPQQAGTTNRCRPCAGTADLLGLHRHTPFQPALPLHAPTSTELAVTGRPAIGK